MSTSVEATLRAPADTDARCRMDNHHVLHTPATFHTDPFSVER